MIEVNNKNDYIRQALKEADRVLSVSKIVPTEFLKDFNDKLEGIIWRINKEDDPRVKFPKWITEELALYKDDGETLDYNAGTKVYEIWTKGQ